MKDAKNPGPDNHPDPTDVSDSTPATETPDTEDSSTKEAVDPKNRADKLDHSDPKLTITDDKMTVLLDWYVTEKNIGQLAETLQWKLIELNIHDPPSISELAKLLKKSLGKSYHLEQVPIKKGRLLIPPRHGRTEWANDFFNTGFVIDKKTGNIDYRQHASKNSVEEGDLLGHQLPSADGRDGLDVLGEPILAEKAELFYPHAGKNVGLDVNEGAYYAKMSGRIRLTDDVLFVDDVYTINGNVDMDTGHISHPGAVVVGGDVLDGFEIKARGDIEVQGVIEATRIQTKGNLMVHGGITGSKGCKIMVKGSIHAKYIRDADVMAGRDIIVEKEIINSSVKTLGTVIIPKGRVVGGDVTALRGIFLGQANSRASVSTVLTAGKHYILSAKLLSKIDKIRMIEENLAKLRSAVSLSTSRVASLTSKKQDAFAQLTAKVSEMEANLEQLHDEMERIRMKALDRAKFIIVIEKMLFPETTLCLGSDKLLNRDDRPGPVRVTLEDGEINIG